jgi:hypothetical protein
VGRLQAERDAALTRAAGLELELEAVKGGHVADLATLRTQVLRRNETLRGRCARGYG